MMNLADSEHAPLHDPQIERSVHLACLMEATARKAGNVHPAAAFEHLRYADFVASAQAIAPVIADVRKHGVGQTILAAVQATRSCCQHNTNLGIILLLAPLAAVPRDRSVAAGIQDVLNSLTREDAASVYEAIRLAAPRGLGQSCDQDVQVSEPEGTLTQVMSLAAHRDSIAEQYATGFELVMEVGVPMLAGDVVEQDTAASPDSFADERTRQWNWPDDWERAVLTLQLALMAVQPDTDIVRKCGRAIADESARRAAEVLNSGWPDVDLAQARFAEFDAWLRADGSQRNPGTTADLVTACLWIAIRDRMIQPPTEDILADYARRISNAT